MTTASARVRRRLSAWCAIENFLNGSQTNPAVVPIALLSSCRPGDGRPIIDDLSLLRTIEEKAKTKPIRGKGGMPEEFELEVVFDDLFLQWAKDDPDLKKAGAKTAAQKKGALTQDVIEHCHTVLGVQCLIGFGHMDCKGTDIDLWLNLPVVESSPLDNSPRHDAFCNAILAFCEKHFPGYDGVSFDLEGVSVMGTFSQRKPEDEPDWDLYQRYLATGEEKQRLERLGHQETDFWTWRVTTNLTHLYRTLALKSTSPPLRPPSSATNRGWDRIVAFAGAGVIGAIPPPDPSAANPTTPSTFYKSRLLEHEANGDIKRVPGQNDFVTQSGTLASAEATFRMHDYFGVRGVRNAIIRPMAYDIFQKNDPRQVLDDWHTDIVRYVRRVMNLHPGNFQLGVKTFDGPGQTSRGMDGVMKDPAWVKQRCQDLLAPEDLGLSLFQISANFWKDANDGLNPTNPFAGLADHPVQVPLNAAAQALYTPTKPPLKP